MRNQVVTAALTGVLALGVMGCGQQAQPQTEATQPTETKTEQVEQKINWASAKDAEAAAKGAGLDKFGAFDKVTFNDYDYKDPKFAYAEGVAQATYDGGANELVLREGASGHKAPLTDRDLTEFATKWTESVADMDVTHYGASRGAATVITWSDGGKDFGVTYQGLGGEEVTLDDEDVSAIVHAVKDAAADENKDDDNKDQNSNDNKQSQNGNKQNSSSNSNNNSNSGNSNSNSGSSNNSGSSDGGMGVKYTADDAYQIAAEYADAGGSRAMATNPNVSGPIEGGGTIYYKVEFDCGESHFSCNVDATDGHVYSASATEGSKEMMLGDNGEVETTYDHETGEVS